MSNTLTNDSQQKTTQHRNIATEQGSKGISMPAVPVLQNKEEQQLYEKEVAQEKTIQTKSIFQFENASDDETQLKQNTPFQLQTTTSANKIEVKQTKPFQLKPNNTGMPNNLKASVENLSGMDMSDVKVHYNSSQPAQLSALAYAQGNDIHIGSWQEKHLPHEAWHVVQQRQGRVQATKQMKMGVAINDDVSLENEADVMGEKAVSTVLPVLQNKNTTITQRVSKSRNDSVFINDHNANGQNSLVVQRVLTFSGPEATMNGAIELLNQAYRVGLPDGQNAQLTFERDGVDAWDQPKYRVVESAQPDQDGIGSHLIGKIINEGTVNIFFGEPTNDAVPTNPDQASLGNATGGQIRLTEGATAIQLIHELIHTYHFNFDPWNALQKEQQVPNGTGVGTVSAEEASTVGLGQWHDFVLTENAFRASMGLPLRTEY